MEKFHKFGDAATGIQPFITVVDPTRVGRLVAMLVFPLRLLVAAVLLLLLTATDLVAYLLYVCFLSLLGRLVVAPLQRLWLRGLMLVLGHVRVQRDAGAAARTRRESRPPLRVQPGAGEVLFCNLQSPWDPAIVEMTLRLPYYTVVLPPGGAAGSLGVVQPGPFHRWQVWRALRQSNTRAYLQRAAAQDGVTLDLCSLQTASSVPLLVFAEGTCSNGKGILSMPPLLVRGPSDSCRVPVADITYDTPAIATAVTTGHWVLGDLFRMGTLLWGTASPAWCCPFSPVATVRAQRVVVDMARRGDVADRCGKLPTVWFLSPAAVDSVRQAMCERHARPVEGRRHPLRVGIRQKLGFVEVYLAMENVNV